MSSDTFCPIPWVFQAVRSNGDVRVCCQANVTKNKGTVRKPDGSPYNAADDDLTESRNADLMKIMRRNMLNGLWSDECQRCQIEEQSGIKSRRDYEKAVWKEVIPDNVAKYTAEDGTLDCDAVPVKHYDLRFGNFCNLACRMCGPQDSTGWYQDWIAMYGKDTFEDTHGIVKIKKIDGKLVSDGYSWYMSDSFWQQLEANADNIQQVYMAGGEPLLIEQHYDFLQRCIDMGFAKNIMLEYNTNMTTMPPRVVNMWQYFRRIKIGASIDGYGSVLEYQRHPARWDKVYENLKRLDAAAGNLSLHFTYTVTAYNLLHITDFMRWKLTDSNLIRFNVYETQPIITYHVAHRPIFANIQILPSEIKDLAKSKLIEFHKWVQQTQPENVIKHSQSIQDGICEFMYSKDLHTSMWPNFVEQTTRLDKIRNQNVLDIIPELEPYL